MKRSPKKSEAESRLPHTVASEGLSTWNTQSCGFDQAAEKLRVLKAWDFVLLHCKLLKILKPGSLTFDKTSNSCC